MHPFGEYYCYQEKSLRVSVVNFLELSRRDLS